MFVCFQCPLWSRYWSPPSIVPCRRELQTSVLHSPALPKVKENFHSPSDITKKKKTYHFVFSVEDKQNLLTLLSSTTHHVYPFPIFFSLSGLPKPVIRWLRNGQELTGNEPGVSILEDGTLLILASVSPLDNGEYVCAAVNDAGSTERKYQLKVNGDWPVL